MKKNAFLLTILIFSIYAIYLVQVKRVNVTNHPKIVFQKSMDPIILGKYKKICFSDQLKCLLNKENSFKVDEQKVLDFRKRFEFIQFERYIENGDKMLESMVPKSSSQTLYVTDENNEIWVHSLGALNLTSDGFFYLLVHNNVKYLYVLKDVWSNRKMYSNEQELNKVSYNNLEEHFKYTLQDFHDLHIFTQIKNQRISKIKIQNAMNIPYEINQGNPIRMQPAIPTGLEYTMDFTQLIQKIPYVQAKKVYFLDKIQWQSPIEATLDLHYENGVESKNQEYLMMKNWNNQYGYFVWPVNSKTLYELDFETAKLFTRPASDYWDKRLILRSTQIIPQSKVDVIFKNGVHKKYTIDLAKNPNKYPQFSLLMDLILGNYGWTQAEYVEFEKEKNKNKFDIIVNIQSMMFGITWIDGKIKAKNLQRNYSLVYNLAKIDSLKIPRMNSNEYE